MGSVMVIRSVSEHLIDPGHPKMDIESLIVSLDGRRVAYIARPSRSRRMVVVDGQWQKEYDSIAKESLAFSPHNQRLAYLARSEGEGVLVIDGEERRWPHVYGDGEFLMFSPNGQRIASLGMPDADSFGVVVDGEEHYPYEEIINLVFSPDSRRIAYVASRGNNWLYVVDGEEHGQWDDSFNFLPKPVTREQVFAPSGERVAYVARPRGKQYVVMNGQEHPRFDEIVNGTLVCSPNGKRVAYVGKTKGGWDDTYAVVVDGQRKEQQYDFPRTPIVFSPDSQHVAYVSCGAAGFLHMETICQVVIDGTAGNGYHGVAASPESRWRWRSASPESGCLFFDSAELLHYMASKKDGIYLVEEPFRNQRAYVKRTIRDVSSISSQEQAMRNAR